MDKKIHSRYGPEIPRAVIAEAADILQKCFATGGKLLICGNGGSAADASHIAGELVKSFERKRPLDRGLSDKLSSMPDVRGLTLSQGLQTGFPAISIASDGAVMSAISNDMGFEFIFAQQVAALGRPGDALLCISTSGSSSNVVYAGLTAKAIGMKVICLVGSADSPLCRTCDIVLAAGPGPTALVQAAHQRAYHELCSLLEDRLLDGPAE